MADRMLRVLLVQTIAVCVMMVMVMIVVVRVVMIVIVRVDSISLELPLLELTFRWLSATREDTRIGAYRVRRVNQHNRTEPGGGGGIGRFQCVSGSALRGGVGVRCTIRIERVLGARRLNLIMS